LCNCKEHFVSLYDQEKKYEKFEIRCGCFSHIKFKVNNDVYEIIEYVSKYNHAFVLEDQKHLIKCRKMIYETCKDILVDMIKVGIRGTTAYKFLANEVG